jgi:hypothetical protein
MSTKTIPKNIVNDAIIKDISDAVDSLDYGTVTIKVSGKKIRQVEIAQKRSFQDVWKVEQGSGI